MGLQKFDSFILHSISSNAFSKFNFLDSFSGEIVEGQLSGPLEMYRNPQVRRTNRRSTKGIIVTSDSTKGYLYIMQSAIVVGKGGCWWKKDN